MLKKTILLTLFLNFNKSYSMNKIGGFFKNFGNAAKNLFKGDKKEDNKKDEKNENKSEENKSEENKKNPNNSEPTGNKNEENTKKNPEEILEFKLKMANIAEYKYYDKINKDFKDILKVEKNKEKIIEIKINKTDNNEDKIKNEIITKLNIGNFISKEDINLSLEKNFIKVFKLGNNSFEIKNLIITKIIDKIEGENGYIQYFNINNTINDSNLKDYDKKCKEFKEYIDTNLRNNKFYKDYYNNLNEKHKNINIKIIEYKKAHLNDEQKQINKIIEEEIDTKFGFIFDIENFESLEDVKKKEVNDIRNKENFEKICDKILEKYKIDDTLKILVNDKKNKKFTEITEHLNKIVTKIEFKIKDENNKKLKKNYSENFNKIVEEYKKGKLETIYHEDIFNIFKEFKLEETETIKFYYKTDNGNEEITANKENNKFFDKNVNNIIYVEFPENFYINNDNDDDIEEETEETEENKEKGENKDEKAKKGYCSKKNDSKNKSKKKGCSRK